MKGWEIKMSLPDDLQKERKELLYAIAEVHSQHNSFDNDHKIGTDKNCKVCQMYLKIQKSNAILNEKLIIVREDEQIIKEFTRLKSALGRLPKEKEFYRAEEIKERFGSWNNFLEKVKIY